MKNLKLLSIFIILLLSFSSSWGDIVNLNTGALSNTFKEAIDQGVSPGDVLELQNNLSNNDFGGSVTIPANVTIKAVDGITDPDQFPIIRTENQNYQLKLSDGVKFERVRFRYYIGNNNGILDAKTGTPIFDKCVFEGAPKIWIRLSSKKLLMTNTIMMNSTEYPIQGWMDASGDVKIYNSTFYNISTDVFHDNNNNTTFPIKIRGCIFDNVSNISNNTNINANVGQSLLYNTGKTNVPTATNIIDKNPRFVGGNNPVDPTDFKLTQLSPGLNYLKWVAGYPDDDIGSQDRSSRNGGEYNDVGAWEYLDYDAPEFVKINKFDIKYDNTKRPDYQHATLDLDIELAPGDWDSIMIRFNSKSDTISSDIASYPNDTAGGYLLYAWGRSELEDVNNGSFSVTNNSDTSWTIKSIKQINVPKSILDDAWGGDYIFGKGYYFTLLVNDNYGNWSNKFAVDRVGNKPLDKMRITPLFSLTDLTSITVEANQTFTIPLKARVDNITVPTPTDYNTNIKATINTGTLNGTTTVPLSSGIGSFSDLSIPTAGDYVITFTTQDTLSYTDQVTIHVKAPPVIQFLDENGKDITNIDLNTDSRITRTLSVKLTQDGNPYAGTVHLYFKDNTNNGRFNNSTATVLNLTFDGTTDEQSFIVTLPLNTNNTIMGVLSSPNKPYVRDSITTTNGDNMVLEFVDSYGNVLPDIINTYSELKNIQLYAVLKTNGGALIEGAKLKFAPNNATITSSNVATDNNGKVSTTATMNLGTLPYVRVYDEINNNIADIIWYDTRNVVIAYQPTGDYIVDKGTAFTDTLRNFKSLSFPITARLSVNGNNVENEDFNFSILNGNASFTTTTATTNSLGNVTASDFQFTPGVLVQGRFETRNSMYEDFVIKADREEIVITSSNNTIKGEAGGSINIEAIYTIDGNPIPGIDIKFSVINNGEGDALQFNSSNPITTDASGKAIMPATVQLTSELNKVKAEKLSNPSIFDDVWVYRVLVAPDNIELLRWSSNSSGVDDTLFTTAGNSGKLLVKITSHGNPIDGTLTGLTIDNTTAHPDFKFSFDNSTWFAPGATISQPIPSSGYLTVYVKDTKAGVVSVTATENSAGGASQFVKINPAGPDMAHSSFVATPLNPYVVGVGKTPNDTTYFTITIRDIYDNVIPNISVNRPIGDPNSTVSVIGAIKLITDANGQVFYKATNTKAEDVKFSVSLTVDSKTLNDKPVVTFLPGPPTAIGSQPVVIYPDTAIANGIDKITIEVHLRDGNGNPIVGKKITDVGYIKIGTQKSPTSYTLTPIISTSDATGLLKWELVDTKAQLDTVKVNVSGSNVPPVPVAVFVPGPAAKVVIQNSPNEGLGYEISSLTIKAGDTLKTIYGVLYDKNNNYIGAGALSNYSWGYVGDNSNKVNPTTNSSNTYFIPTKVGQGRVWTKYGSLVDTTGILNIIGGDPTYVKVSTENHQIETAGVPFGTQLTLYDKFDNVSSFSGEQSFSFTYDTVGAARNWFVPTIPATVSYTFTNGVSAGNQGSFVLKSADVNYYLIATAGTINTDTTNSQIDVVPGAYTKLKVLTQLSGYTQEFDTATIDFKTTINMHASKFDDYLNYIGDMNAKWLLGDGNLIAENNIVYNQFGDVNGVFKFNPDDSSVIKGATLGKIRAEDPSNSAIYDLTGNIKVVTIPDHIVITSNAQGLVDSLYNNNTIRVAAGDTLSLYASTYDTNNGFIANFTSNWGYNFNIHGEKNNLITNSVYDFMFTKVDTGIVFANALSTSMTGKREDSTGTIIVLPAKPEAILVKVIGNKTVTAGDTVPVSLTLIDKFGNIVNTNEGDVTVQKIVFNVIPSQITPAPHNQDVIYPQGPFTFTKGLDTTFLIFSKATNLPTDQPKITAEVPGVYKPANQDTVWVNVGAPHHIKIMYGTNPAIDTVEAGNMTLTIDDSVSLVSILYDKMGNYISTSQSNWNTSGFAKEKAVANSNNMVLGPFFGLTDKGDVFATPVVSGIIGDTAPNFKVIAGKPVDYDIHVYKALGLTAPMGDTVAANYGFNIKIRLLDRLGNFVQNSTLDTQNLNFKWGVTQKYPAGELNGDYVFVNGEVIINDNQYPWMLDHTGKDSLLVFNTKNTFMQSWGIFWGIDKSGPTFSNDLMDAYDNNGDGFIDSIVVKFSEPIDTSKIKKGIESAFMLVPDSLRSDAVTKWLNVVSVKPIDTKTVALIVEISADAPSTLIPQTDLEPKVTYLGNTLLPNGVGIFDLDGNAMLYSTANTQDRVGPVIVYAKYDDNCDNYLENDKLILTLSENINNDSLLAHLDPKTGIVILRKVSEDSVKAIYLKNSSIYSIDPYTIGNEVIIETHEAIAISVGRDYVKLLVGGGYRDTTVYKTDTPKNNKEVKIRYANGFCENSFGVVPNPPYTPNRVPTNGSGTGGSGSTYTGAGAVFKISTDRPAEFKIQMLNVQGNLVNEFKFRVTKQMLAQYGQEEGERLDFYFGVEGKDGYLTPIPLSQYQYGFDINNIDQRLRWMPVNKVGRYVTAGAYFMKYYANYKYTGTKTIIVK